ncbi:MAG: hypothetical protein ACUVWR_15865 [Anaerolineae bacterium]
MKSISVSWASGVEDEEAVQCLTAIVDVITYLYHRHWPMGLIVPIVGLRPFGSWVIPALPEGSPYSSFDWYVESAYNEDWQAMDAERFLSLVEAEPWQQESHHYDFSVVHLPLRLGNSPNHLGLASRPNIASVVSADWARFYDSIEMQRLALRRLAFQGIGLAFGLEPHNTREAPICALRLVVGHNEFLAKALEEHKAGIVYCDEHLRALLGKLLSGREPLN